MIKFASITLTILVVSWLRIGLQNSNDNKAIDMLLGFTMLWLAVFGTYIAWFVLLAMVRQLGAAMRGK